MLEMTPPSLGSTIGFLIIVLTLVVAFIAAVRSSGLRLGEDPARTRRLTAWAIVGSAGWLAVTAAASASGVLRANVMPPPLMIFFLTLMGVALATSLGPLGERLARGAPLAALVGVQAFRLPLELVLSRWHAEGVVPVQMTFHGHNFDIITGVLALLLWLAARRGPLPRAVVFAFNVVGLALLIAVVAIVVLSSPIPLRRYQNDPPVLLAFYAPYVWIGSVCVAGALFTHVVVFRALRAAAPT